MVFKGSKAVEMQDGPKYRYVCHGCTKAAAYARVPIIGNAIVCPHCHKSQSSVEENWVRMTDTEVEAYEHSIKAKA